MVKLKQIASNFTSVETGDLTLYFSYENIVAFHIAGRGFYASVNQWSVTTGKHLARFGTVRTPADVFNEFVNRLGKRVLYGGRNFYADSTDHELESKLVKAVGVSV